MASLELCPLSEHLEDSEIDSLLGELEAADVADVEFADDADPVPIDQGYDEDVFVDFWDQLEANDAACDVYLPADFEDTFELDGRRFGSAHALLIVLANIKEDMFLDDDEEEADENDEAIEDIDDELDEFDDYGAEEEQYESEEDGPSGLKEQQMRRVWRALNKAARASIGQQLALFVHE
ncbi:MAG: hypothetical protein KJO07_21240 [Deltaproteobacteria bacterium]|nr:hypothetical protein [Deltaproteobacteria bacterium]